MSQVVSFESLSKIQWNYTKQHYKLKRRFETDPLFVYSIRSERGLKKFENLTSNDDLMQAPWLLIFRINTSFNCENPVGNPFNLKIHSRMIVKCFNSYMIKKYYSVVENATKVENLSLWIPGKNLEIPNNHQFDQLKNGIQGKKLRIVQVSNFFIFENLNHQN